MDSSACRHGGNAYMCDKNGTETEEIDGCVSILSIDLDQFLDGTQSSAENSYEHADFAEKDAGLERGDSILSIDLDQFLDGTQPSAKTSHEDADFAEKDADGGHFPELTFKRSVAKEIAQYQLHRCTDASSSICRMLKSFCVCIGFILAVSFMVVAVYVMPPFAAPSSGFWENWVFNCIAHPVANFVIARGALLPALKMLDLPPELGVKKIVTVAALAAPVTCFLTHLAFRIFPVPFAAPVPCQPAVLATSFLSFRLLPKEARDKKSWRALKFFVFFIVTCQGMIAMLLIALVYFGTLLWPADLGNLCLQRVCTGSV
eukprot:s913_g3.t1